MRVKIRNTNDVSLELVATIHFHNHIVMWTMNTLTDEFIDFMISKSELIFIAKRLKSINRSLVNQCKYS